MQSSEWGTTITRIYRETTAEAGPDGVDRQEAIIVASARIATEIRAGRLAYELDDFIHSELIRADESDGRRGDSVLKTLLTGQGSFPIDDGLLDIVVTLGKGRRKQWRDVTAADLSDMNDVRSANARNVRKSFEDWAADYNEALPVLFEFGTVGSAVESGGFPPATASRTSATA